MRPCLVCGTPSPRSRCPDHRAPRSRDTRIRKTKGQAAHDPTWRKLSTRARRASPFCEDCGAVNDLTADHIIPKAVAPELVHAPENIAVRCRPCNSRRGTQFADTDASNVLARLHTTYQRRPTQAGRDRITAAERALTRGDAPTAGGTPRRGEARGAMKTTSGVPDEVG